MHIFLTNITSIVFLNVMFAICLGIYEYLVNETLIFVSEWRDFVIYYVSHI